MNSDALRGRAVLWVDAHQDLAELAAGGLRLAGAEVRIASGGDDALTALHASWRPDVLVIDPVLPDLNGYELLRAVRRTESLQDIPAVAVSAYRVDADRLRAVSSGFAAFVGKPFELDELVTILAIVTASARPRQQ